MKQIIKNRYDFIYLFDVKDGNPNGDPDQANLPRADIEDQHGLVTDVCIKRKVRNYIQVKFQCITPNNIFIRQGNVLNDIIDNIKMKTVNDRQIKLCEEYYDIRVFGAVLSTGEGAGTVRGPVQLTFARSVDRIYQAEHSITRCAVTTQKEAESQKDREYASTFGRKSTVPYALYRMHGFISASDAVKSGFTEDDLSLLWEALLNAFEHDRSAARGEMNPRKLIIFKHSSALGNSRSGELFNRIIIEKTVPLPRSYQDYSININKTKLPEGIELIEKL